MDVIVTVAAVVMFGLAVTTLLYFPFRIGKPRTGNYTAAEYLLMAVQCGAFILMAGRVWGWW